MRTTICTLVFFLALFVLAEGSKQRDLYWGDNAVYKQKEKSEQVPITEEIPPHGVEGHDKVGGIGGIVAVVKPLHEADSSMEKEGRKSKFKELYGHLKQDVSKLVSCRDNLVDV
jgi:hypothetical protein